MIAPIPLIPFAKLVCSSHFSLRRSMHNRAQSRTILNLWTAPQTRPSRHQTLPGSGPRHGRRTDREQHIADKIRSVEEKLR
jgi:hypothetical protein